MPTDTLLAPAPSSAAAAPPANPFTCTPTFAHSYRAERLPSGNYRIFDVPVFAAPEEAAKGFTYTRGWLESAYHRALERKRTGYLAPIHVGHHDAKGQATPENRIAGFMDPRGVRDIEVVTDKGVEILPAYFVDMTEVPPGVFEEIRRLRYPYRSAEVLRPSVPDLSSLALLEHEVPFHRLPVLKVEEEAGERVCFRYTGGITMPGTSDAPPAAPPAPAAADGEKPAKFAEGSGFPPSTGGESGGGKGEGEKPAPKPESSGAVNVHAKTVIKAACSMLMGLIEGHEEQEQKSAAKAKEDPAMAQAQQNDGKAAGAPSAVPQVPSYSAGASGAGAGEKPAQFSAEAISEIARLTAENQKLRLGAVKSDEQRIDEAVQRFRAANLVFDEKDLRDAIARYKLAGETITAFAVDFEKHLIPAPPRPGTSFGIAGTPAGGGSPSDNPKMFLAADESLKKFCDEQVEVQRAAVFAAQEYDSSEKLRGFFSGNRFDYVAAAVAREKRVHRKV